jgi:hypothetical protein
VVAFCPWQELVVQTGHIVAGKHLLGEGNVVCGGRYVKRAMHGTRLLSWSELRETYGRELVNLRNEQRYSFLNTLFSVSEAVMYMQVCAITAFAVMRPCCLWQCWWHHQKACWGLCGRPYLTQSLSYQDNVGGERQHLLGDILLPERCHDGKRWCGAWTASGSLRGQPVWWRMQMVDRMDQGAISPQVVSASYEQLWKLVSKALYRTHVEGKLKVRPSFPVPSRALPHLATGSRYSYALHAWMNIML